MKRRTLDIVFAGGGAVIAIAMLFLGIVLLDQYNWGKEYVKEELASQKIVFAEADKLTDQEKNWKPGSKCLVENAGKTMETGAQAECYAKYYIGLHLEESAAKAGFEGETYATLGGIRTQLAAEVKAAKDKGDTAAADAAQKKLDSATSLRTTMQSGETLRGLLLTSYGFSIFGDKAYTVAQISFVLAALLALLSVAGFVHAWMAKDEKVFDSKTTAAAPGKPATVS